MKIGVTSDLHGNLPQIKQCDLLLICGDIIPLNIQFKTPASKEWIVNEFLYWANNAPCEKVVFIAGNHDFLLYRKHKWIIETLLDYPKIHYLKNELLILPNNIKIFGTPYCKIFGSWAFMRDDRDLKRYYSELPYGTDILISHDAPNMLELGTILEGNYAGEICGNIPLKEAIINKKPKYAFCGHIHSGNHNLQEFNGTTFANVSLLNEDYKVAYNVLYLEI